MTTVARATDHFHGYDFSAGPLNVSFVYFGHRRTGRIVELRGNSVDVEFFLKSAGRNVVRTLEIVPSERLRRAGGSHQVQLNWDSADRATRHLTSFKSLMEMCEAKGGYRPTIMQGGLYALLANTYDRTQQAHGDSRRAYRRVAA